MEGMLDSPDGHSDPVGRRDFLYAALAASALAAMPRQALAQPAPKPPRLTVFALDIYTGLPAADCGSISRFLRASSIAW